MRDRVLALFEENHLLVEESALALILASPTPLDVSRAVIAAGLGTAGGPVVTPARVASLLTRATLDVDAPGGHLPSPLESGGLMLEPPARELGPAPSAPRSVVPEAVAVVARVPRPFEILRQGFVAPTEAADPLEGVTALLRSRYRQLARVLRGRPEMGGVRPAAEVARSPGEGTVIGMVRDVSETARQKLLILTLEDESGTIRVLLPKDHAAARDTYLPDEVLGVKVQVPDGADRLPIARSIHRPEVPAGRTARHASRASKVLFLSDLHVGSKGFLHDAWNELMGFVRGEGEQGARAEGLEHVVIAGDLVDGIGIYPHQERDLAIQDIFEQYVELGRRLRELPSHLNIVAVPGNHDAVCPAEPQPALPAELSSHLPANVHMVSNPSIFSLEGVVVEAYHGRSFDDLIPQLPKMRYEEPIPVMKRMLSMRHLAPSYGQKTPLAPLPRDGLVIDPLPDIFVTGHTHTFGVERWRGTLLLNASTWLEETDYQRMRNIRPVPGRATVVDLASGAVSAVDFHASRPSDAASLPPGDTA